MRKNNTAAKNEIIEALVTIVNEVAYCEGSGADYEKDVREEIKYALPSWRKIDPENPPKQQDYFYLRRGENVTKEYMTSRMQWLGLYESGYTHYLTESDILSLPKE